MPECDGDGLDDLSFSQASALASSSSSPLSPPSVPTKVHTMQASKRFSASLRTRQPSQLIQCHCTCAHHHSPAPQPPWQLGWTWRRIRRRNPRKLVHRRIIRARIRRWTDLHILQRNLWRFTPSAVTSPPSSPRYRAAWRFVRIPDAPPHRRGAAGRLLFNALLPTVDRCRSHNPAPYAALSAYSSTRSSVWRSIV